MHRVDTEGHADGLFEDGSPQIGQAGTMLTEEWFNDVQENICSVIEAATDDEGEPMVLEKGNFDQLRLAIASMIAEAKSEVIIATRVPVGARISLDGTVVPDGWLATDGGQHLKADYPDLVAFYEAQGRLIAGDGPTQFRMPDYRGRFGRAWSDSSAVDPEGPRAPGSLQADAFKSHKHTTNLAPLNTLDGSGVGNIGSGNNVQSGNAFRDSDMVGDLETRPKNVASMWIIKT